MASKVKKHILISIDAEEALKIFNMHSDKSTQEKKCRNIFLKYYTHTHKQKH